MRVSLAPYGPTSFGTATCSHILQPDHLGRTRGLLGRRGSLLLRGTVVIQFQVALDQFKFCLAQASQLQLQRPLIT